MSVLFLALLPLANAEDASPEPAEPDPDPAPAPAPDDGGMRRRRATVLLVGLETVSDDFDNHLSAPMGGLDVAFGAQIDDTFGVYVPLHLSFGAFSGLGTVAGLPAGLTGTFAATVVGDATFADRFFVGGGGGVGVLNNPTGPCLHLRAGGYPVVGHKDGGPRRTGLVVAADLRVIFAGGITGTYPALSVGYASF